jgi:hypothetical protein
MRALGLDPYLTDLFLGLAERGALPGEASHT